jgi:hypothetical protein
LGSLLHVRLGDFGMNDTDPSDPVPLNRAIRELASRWETDANSAGDTRAEIEQPNTLIWEMSKAQLERHFGSFADAALHLFRHAIVSQKIRVWVENGPDWKRPTLHTIMRHLPPESGLYADRREMAEAFNRQWAGAFPDRKASVTEPRSADRRGDQSDLRAPTKRGRPRTDGYSRKDVPIFEKILKAQRESGDVHNPHALIVKFAEEADGNSFQAKVDRLRKALPRWLEKNGFEWTSSK